MIEIVETARAKINLTLSVHGRRDDGYHELESIVAFAGIGDRLVLRRSNGAASRLTVTGPFAPAIAGTNLVERALELVAAEIGQPLGVDVTLDKLLPVASGIGGGSADAAAALRAVRAARDMRRALRELNQHRHNEGLPAIRIGIGWRHCSASTRAAWGPK